MGRQNSFNYIIIGSGAHGHRIALKHAARKQSVAIIEAKQWGGSEINTRDLVFETALELSHLYYLAHQGVKMGLSSDHLRYNYPSVLNYRNRIIKQARIDAKKQLSEAGITCIHGFAHFVNKKEIVVNGKHLTADKFIITTGKEFAKPGLSGQEHCYTSDEAFTLKRPPKCLTVVGAGWSGCMIAQYYAELGSDVTLLETKARILPGEQKTVSEETHRWLAEDLNVKIINNARVVTIQKHNGNEQITIWHHHKTEQGCLSNSVILATGYHPATDCGLENAKVNYTHQGIVVDKTGRTSNKYIWAAGDVVA